MFIADYLVVIALDEEYRYAIEVLQDELGVALAQQPDRAVVLALAPVPLRGKTSTQDELLVVACPGQMGHTAMAAALPGVISRWRPRDIIQIGISGSFDSGNLKLGDVLVPMRVFGYAQAKVESVDDWTFRTLGGETTSSVRAEFRTIANDPKLRDPWERKCVEAGRKIEQLTERITRAPAIHIHENDSLATGNFVVASSVFAARLREKVATTLVAVDMEAGGLFEAMAKVDWSSRVSIVRGISDYADQDKAATERDFKNGWRLYAMQNAARLASRLIIQRPRWPHTRESASPPYEIRFDRHPESYEMCLDAGMETDQTGAFHVALAPFLCRKAGSPGLHVTIGIDGPDSAQAMLILRERPSTWTEIRHRPRDPCRIELYKEPTDESLELDALCSARGSGIRLEITLRDDFGRLAQKAIDFSI